MPRAPMPAEVRRDAVGVPHLRAGDVMELARLQGRIAALDRGWQIEHHRWRMEGRTAEYVGADGLHWDRFARQVLLEPTVRRCFERLDRETRTWLSAYVDGVNDTLAAGARGHARGRAARAPVVCRRAASVGAVDAARHLLGDPPALRDLPGEAVQRARRRPSRRRRPRDVPRRGRRAGGGLGEQRLGRRRGPHGERAAAHRGRPAPHDRAARLLPAGGPGLPRVRRRRLHLPGGARRAALRPHGHRRMGHHERDGRLPGPDTRVARSRRPRAGRVAAAQGAWHRRLGAGAVHRPRRCAYAGRPT